MNTRLKPNAVIIRNMPKVSNLSANGSHKYAIIAPNANGAIMSEKNHVKSISKINAKK